MCDVEMLPFILLLLATTATKAVRTKAVWLVLCMVYVSHPL